MAVSSPGKRSTSAAAFSSTDDSDPTVGNSERAPTLETDPLKVMLVLTAALNADDADAGWLSGSHQTGAALLNAMWSP